MKSLKLLLLGLLLVGGCKVENEGYPSRLQTVIIDNCEYIESKSQNGHASWIRSYCHKGNCTNEIHKVDCWGVK